MDNLKELFADIRNKLQPCKTVLEVVSSKKVPSEESVKAAMQGLDLVVSSINNYEEELNKPFLKSKP